MIATKTHDDMAREGRAEEMKNLIYNARTLRDSLRGSDAE